MEQDGSIVALNQCHSLLLGTEMWDYEKDDSSVLEKSLIVLASPQQLLSSIPKFGCILCCAIKMFHNSLKTVIGYCKNINYCHDSQHLAASKTTQRYEQNLMTFLGNVDNGPKKSLLCVPALLFTVNYETEIKKH